MGELESGGRRQPHEPRSRKEASAGRLAVPAKHKPRLRSGTHLLVRSLPRAKGGVDGSGPAKTSGPVVCVSLGSAQRANRVAAWRGAPRGRRGANRGRGLPTRRRNLTGGGRDCRRDCVHSALRRQRSALSRDDDEGPSGSFILGHGRERRGRHSGAPPRLRARAPGDAVPVHQRRPAHRHHEARRELPSSPGSELGTVFVLNHWVDRTPTPRRSLAILNARAALLGRAQTCQRIRPVGSNGAGTYAKPLRRAPRSCRRCPAASWWGSVKGKLPSILMCSCCSRGETFDVLVGNVVAGSSGECRPSVPGLVAFVASSYGLPNPSGAITDIQARPSTDTKRGIPLTSEWESTGGYRKTRRHRWRRREAGGSAAAVSSRRTPICRPCS
jgi:hypothetical protein